MSLLPLGSVPASAASTSAVRIRNKFHAVRLPIIDLFEVSTVDGGIHFFHPWIAISMVKLPDRLTVATCDVVRQFVAEQLAQYGDVRVDASSVDSIDLSGVQIIVAAAQTARQANRSFSLAGPASPPVTRAFELAGISLESFGAAADARA